MIRGVKSSLLAAVSLALAGCAATGGGETASASDKPAEKPAKFNKNPYPSTYKPYPGQVTAVRNVTIFDGEGGRIDNGTVLLADGKVRSEEQTSELQSLMRISYDVFCLKKKNTEKRTN